MAEQQVETFAAWYRASWRDAWQKLGTAPDRKGAAGLIAARLRETADLAHGEFRIAPATGCYLLSHRANQQAPWLEVGRCGTSAEAGGKITDGGDWLLQRLDDAPGA